MLPTAKPKRPDAKMLDGTDVAALFGLEMADGNGASEPAHAASEPARVAKTPNRYSTNTRAKPRATRKPLRRARANA